MKTIISKGEFAKRKDRTPQCVSKWISKGKITKAALIGEGNSARIWLERAEADLAASLDPSQQLIQASPILPIGASPGIVSQPDEDLPAAASLPQLSATSAKVDARSNDLARRAKADADRAELDAESARRRLAIDEGRYVVADEAARAWGREMSRFIADTETFLTSTLARDLAIEFGKDWKSVSVKIRDAYRQFRGHASESARQRREQIESETVDAG